MAFQITVGKTVSALESREGSLALSLSSPLLRGTGTECLFPDELHLETMDEGLVLGHAGELLVFAQVSPLERNIAAQTKRYYQQLLSHLVDYSLLRIWNYIPAINAIDRGMEHYQAFCVGRAEAFEMHFAAHGLEARYPAGSAVGIKGDQMVMYGVACRSREEAHYFENPDQIPAYRYPPRYGPKPPSFSRASVFNHVSGEVVYISGTASVIGHETRHPHQIDKQLQTTKSLLDSLFDQLEWSKGGPLSADWLHQANLCLYLRDASAAPLAETWMRTHFPLADGHWRMVQADLCRSDLVAEIEVSLHPLMQRQTQPTPLYASADASPF